jgi:hypothetical protein
VKFWKKGDNGIWVRTAFNLVVMALKKLKIAEYNF